MVLAELKSLCPLLVVLLHSLAMSGLTEIVDEPISSVDDDVPLYVFRLVGTVVATVSVAAAIYISVLLVASGLGPFASAAS